MRLPRWRQRVEKRVENGVIGYCPQFQTTRRRITALLCGAPALLLSQAKATGREIPEEWRDLWQPRLPQQERHPSLFYGEADRDRMRSRLNAEPWKTWWAGMQGNSARSNAAFRWWLTGDVPPARAACLDLVKTPIYRQQPQSYLEPSSHHLSDYVAAYDLLASWPDFTAEDRAAVRAKIAAEADYYCEVLAAGPRGGANFGNQRTLAASAAGMAALALCEDSKRAAPWLSRALYEIRREENIRFFRAGGQFVEGVGYVNYQGLQLLPFAIAYERASGKFLFEEPRLRESLIFAAHQMTGGGDAIPWGTSELWRGIEIFALFSNRRYGRDMAPLFAWCFRHTLQPHSLHRHIALAQYDETPAGVMPPASRIFAASHTAVFRDDWTKPCVAVWFAGKEPNWWDAATYNSFSHGDSGAFVLAVGDELLATDAGYDHWKSKTYYDAKYHNVLLIDGEGPRSQTTGEMSDATVEGPVRHATVTSVYQGCTVRRFLALVRGRYVVVVDRVVTDADHQYAWQLHSACAPGDPRTRIGERTIVWPGSAFDANGKPMGGNTELITIAPEFAKLSLAVGGWRPRSALPEVQNQTALAEWRAGETIALFVLLPNSKQLSEVTAAPGEGQRVTLTGAGWSDTVSLHDREVRIASNQASVNFSCRL